MTDFSDCIGYINRVKVEYHERFGAMLATMAIFERRIAALEPEERLERKWNTEPYASYGRAERKKQDMIEVAKMLERVRDLLRDNTQILESGTGLYEKRNYAGPSSTYDALFATIQLAVWEEMR